MPSRLFQELAKSQLELLVTSLVNPTTGTSKLKSAALYVPQEHVKTGQLEFVPLLCIPQSIDRIFIANQAAYGRQPQVTIPQTLSQLPGFAHATSLLPGYPMVNTGEQPGIGVVEEVLCDLGTTRTTSDSTTTTTVRRGAALSVPLFSGSQTVGVLLVSPSDDLIVMNNENDDDSEDSVWTEQDKEQVARAAKSLSLALSMDTERSALQHQNVVVQQALSDGLHQLKNPLQALRTYGKLLQRRIADTNLQAQATGGGGQGVVSPQLLELADHIMIQSDRLVDRLEPVDTIVDSILGGQRALPYALPQSPPPEPQTALVPWQDPTSSTTTSYSTMPAKRIKDEDWRSTPPPDHQDTTTPPSLPPDTTSKGFVNSEKIFSSHLFDGAMEFEMSFVTDIMEPIISSFSAIAQDRHIGFVVEAAPDDLPGVTVCPNAVQEVMSNVLDNAFKYVVLDKTGGPNPTPTVQIRFLRNAKPRKPGVTILVDDNGPGIASTDWEAVFQRGFRAAATQSVQGKGIGLDIARSLAEKMGGSLRVTKPDSMWSTTMELVLYRNPDVPLNS